MNEIVADSLYFGALISIAGYMLGLFLKQKFKTAILNPLIVSIVFVIAFIKIFGIAFENYNNGAKYLSYLLTPATVCLAVPLYRRLKVLKDNIAAVLIGIGAGAFASLISVYLLSKLMGFTHEMYVTLLPKSVTTAIGIEVASELGGDSSVAAAVIILTGVLGNVCADLICKIFRIKNPVAVGLAIGCASHAVGTSRAMELGAVQGAMSSLAIVVAGVMTVILAPIFALLPM